MIRTVLVAVPLSIANLAAAAGNDCSSLASQAEKTQGNFFPPAEAKIISKAKLSFYEAPSKKCKIPNAYSMPGKYLTVHKIYEGWANVMFIPEAGEDIIAWVPSNQLKLMGQYGRNP